MGLVSSLNIIQHLCFLISIYLAKFEETKLPNREDFTNDLTKKEISDEDWDFIRDLWKTFDLQNLGELHNLYMECDVILLSDVMEGFKKFYLEKYRLDPAHFNTSPGLSWSACLLLTKQKLEIPTDPKMHLFFDRG